MTVTKPDIESVNQAKRALAAFRGLQPTLTVYAQMLTGRRDIRVVAAAHDNGSTDGKRIYYRPPIALGENIPHERWNCDKRRESGILKCRACARREVVLVTIYHEIAHVWFDSFKPIEDRHKVSLIRDALAASGSAYAKAIQDRIAKAFPSGITGYVGLASLISEFLPIILNCLEDARVNRELFRSLPGTKKMFDAFTVHVIEDGVEQYDHGSWVKILWRDYKLNQQIMTGIFCKASGYDYSNWFSPEVVEALNDPKLTELVAQTNELNSIADLYSAGFPILQRLRELGFCRLPDDPDEPDDEPDESIEPDDEPDESDEPDDELDESDEPDDELDESDGSSSSMDDGTGTSGDEQQDEASDDEAEGEAQGDDSEGDTEGGPTGSGNSEVEPDTTDGSGESDEDGEPDHGGGEVGGSTSAESEGDGGNPSRGHDSGDRGEPWKDGDEDDSHAAESSEPATGEHDEPSEQSDSREVTHPDGDSSDTDERPSVDGDDEELIDTGSYDKSTRLVEVKAPKRRSLEEMGTPEECRVGVAKLGDHEEKPDEVYGIDAVDLGKAAMDVAIIQGMYFEHPSTEILGVREFTYPESLYDLSTRAILRAGSVSEDDAGVAWSYSRLDSRGSGKVIGLEGDFDPPEPVLAPALLAARAAFADNVRSKHLAGLKAGKVNPRVLGKRAPLNDPRLMRKKLLPHKKDHFVLIGVDISFSTIGVNLNLAKQVAMAEAEICSRLGIKFAIYAHTGGRDYNIPRMMNLHIYKIKEPDQVWDDRARERLRRIGPEAANLDGHTMEYYRKVLDRERAKSKILHYYTDGAMPCENFEEELEILQREIRTCRLKQYTVLGVGIRTDAPKQHGLETVEVNEQADIIQVVRHLEKHLMA